MSKLIALILIVAGGITLFHIGGDLAKTYGFEQGFNGFMLGALVNYWLLKDPPAPADAAPQEKGQRR